MTKPRSLEVRGNSSKAGLLPSGTVILFLSPGWPQLASAGPIFPAMAALTFGQTVATSIEGNWIGILEFNGTRLRLAFKVAKVGDGFQAKFDSLIREQRA